MLLPLLPLALSPPPLSCNVPPSDPLSPCLHGHVLPCSGRGVCHEGVCVCEGDWIGKNCDFNSVTTTLFMEERPSSHEACIANTWRTAASAAFLSEVEQLHEPSRCRPSSALLHRNLETRQGLGAMMLFAVGALTMSMQRNMAAVCVGQFFYDSWGACKQQPDFEPPLLCLFEPVWGCTSSALIDAANGSSISATSDPEESVQELTSFDSSAYEVPAVSLPPLLCISLFSFSLLFSGHSQPQGAGLLLAAGSAFIVRFLTPTKSEASKTYSSPLPQLLHAAARCCAQQTRRRQSRP